MLLTLEVPYLIWTDRALEFHVYQSEVNLLLLKIHKKRQVMINKKTNEYLESDDSSLLL